MILTVTLNPSVDISYPLDSLALDTVNRVTDERKTAGGKGLNVTRVLSEVGDSVTATGLIGGKLGEFLTEQLEQSAISHRFFTIKGETRNCIAILHDEGQQTEILEAGPSISPEEAAGFLAYFQSLCPNCEVITMSGSLPNGLAVDYYTQLIALANSCAKKVVLDCSGKALEAVLKGEHKPFAIKPNTEELSQLVGQEVTDDLAVLKSILAKDLFAGIEWIIVSLGAKGAFAKHGDRFYRVHIPKISVVNPVGSGDSTVAGLASALVQKKSDEDLLKHANVLGMLNAQEKVTGHVNMDHYDNLFKQIEVEEV